MSRTLLAFCVVISFAAPCFSQIPSPDDIAGRAIYASVVLSSALLLAKPL